MNRNHRTILIGGGAVVAIVAGIFIVSAAIGQGGTREREHGHAPEQTSDGGSAAGMEMSGGGGEGTIRLTREQIGTFGITFGRVEERMLSRTVRTVGLVEFDETRMAYVAPRFGGWVERLHVDFTGQMVRRGQPLLDVYSPELVAAQEELLLAARLSERVSDSRVENVSEGAGDLLDSALRRLRYWDISEGQIERLLETGEVRRTLTIHAPATGVVMEKDVFPGQAFQAGRNLYMIADLSSVWVSAEVYEGDAAFVQEGMEAEVRISALPGRAFRGRIDYVYPTLEDRTRSMRARITIPNPAGAVELRPGMYATVEIHSELGSALTVPSSALLHSGRRAVAFVDLGGGEIAVREVVVGARGEDRVEVLDGLEPGERVVTSAHFLLDSESNLAEVMRAMMAEMGMSDMEMDMDGDMRGLDVPGDDGMGGMEMDGSGGGH